ncbi:hypothetical protein GOP47_0007637 [Adiantum capillus-veneris]|uniref:Glycosyltransferase n=1 Tax=Adiantum capillus-veneris TaxID=13818 RepID=A0A9D4ZJE8_ADICA|nr:hypothetical protein GOP47_0007637 [Adiantum capillus-veneris]
MAGGEARHVLVVPWSGEGHVIGMLRLALLLAAQKGLLISFGYPARAHALALKRGKLPNFPPSLRVHVVEDGLPAPDHEPPRLHHLRDSSLMIVQSLEALLQQHVAPSSETALSLLAANCCDAALDGANEINSSPSWPPVCCIISDTFLAETQALANSFSIPRIHFWTGNATVYNIFLHVPQLLAKGILLHSNGIGKVEYPLIDFIPGLPACHVTQLPWDLIQKYEVSQPMIEFLINAFSSTKDADRILVHSVYELEKHVYDAMQAQGFRIYAIGPLFETNSESGAARNECLDWLDRQKTASVVYVAFGTVTGLSLLEMQSMALGLEASNQPFLWVVPKDPLATISNSSESFWEGFIERTVSGWKGCIVAWAPQKEVLKHKAVGAFISHCGWNSVLESLWGGVPIVTCCRVAEQNCNAKSVVEEWKVGIEMERKDDGGFTTEAVRKAIVEVMGNQEVKARALHIKQVVRHAVGAHGTSHSNLTSLIDHLLHLPVPRQVI